MDKLTDTQLEIVAALYYDIPRSAKTVHSEVNRNRLEFSGAYLALSTVRNNLAALERMGIIELVDIHNKAKRYRRKAPEVCNVVAAFNNIKNKAAELWNF